MEIQTPSATLLNVLPMPEDFLQRVRQTGLDDLNQPVRRSISAEGGEPCRDALRRAYPGEELILASFSPFTQVGPYREYGPVFILANPDPTPLTLDTLPIFGETAYLRKHFAVRAYSHYESILDAALVTPENAYSTIEKFFSRDDVAFVHARFPSYGCFACRIDRAE